MSDRTDLLLALADDELILGWRNSEWTGIAPFLEEDVAFSSIAQNEIGHARALYELAAAELGTTADELAFDRKPEEYRSAPLVELRRLEWARTIARHWLYETADEIRLAALKASDDPEIAGLAAKIDREEAYHRMHAEMWIDRLLATEEGSSRLNEAVDELWPYALGVLDAELRPELKARAERAPGTCAPGRRGGAARRPRSGARGAVGGDDDGAALRSPRIAMVTADEVWEALADIPDPEIPVISLVDLGVVKGVAVDNGTVRVDFTPTFMGCPALEVMQRAMEATIAELGATADIRVRLDDSWSTDDITAEGREKLRVAGFAPPTPRPAERLELVQLQRGFRCPYCGSTETKLENLFGPTPCRSIRYCEDCRQPFEQFKTI